MRACLTKNAGPGKNRLRPPGVRANVLATPGVGQEWTRPGMTWRRSVTIVMVMVRAC